MKRIAVAVCGVAVMLSASADETTSRASGAVVPALDSQTTDVNLDDARPEKGRARRPRTAARAHYTGLEQEAIRLSKEWGAKRIAPARGEAGVVRYVYGGVLPSVVCTPLYVCDIALQPGETVLALHAGDATRWRITPTLGENATPHVLVKPTDAGLRTNLLVLSDRRTYVIQMVSDTQDWMPRVAFSYPEDLEEQTATLRKATEKKRADETLPGGKPIAKLDFDYRIIGEPRWRPVRVYNDGVKTYVEFPEAMKYDEAPALVALGTGDKEQIVNYRIDDTRYIVDRVLARALLISGTGDEQQRVELLHAGETNAAQAAAQSQKRRTEKR